MPPKKRAAAAAPTVPDPAPSRARSTRDVKTEQPASATTTTRSKRTATQKTAEEPVKKKTKTLTSVVEVQEEIITKVEEAPKRRGRPAKTNGPLSDVVASALEMKAVATPRRGRSSAAQADEVVEDVVADAIAAAPKRRGRPSNAVVEAKTDPAPEVSTTDTAIPKRRGRPGKSAAKTEGVPAHEEVAEDVAPAKRRGRPAKINGAAGVDAEEPSSQVTTAPKRRGRPAKTAAASISETAQEVSKEIATGAAEPPKRRGRPAKPIREWDAKQATSVPTAAGRPKRGGRAVNTKAAQEPLTEAAAPADGAPRRRGRPAKPATAASPKPVAGQKRGLSPSAQLREELEDAVEEPDAAGKGRERRKRTATEAAATGPSNELLAKKAKTTAKAAEAPSKATKAPAGKRGRKPASALKHVESQSSAVKDTTSRNDTAREAEGPSYWLMKSEPDTRFENGVDVSFSIDDLKTRGGSERWDGVRNVVAMNNMRNMKVGDLAFFYHSNTKVPGIAGIMEIVQESSPDESAFDPNHYRYDPKSSRDSPKWHCVHVSHRHKFTKLIPLKDLQANAKEDGPLSSMQLLKQSRLSVSRVSKSEWDFIMSLAPDFESDEAEQPNETADSTELAVVSSTDLVPTVEAALLGTDEVTLLMDQQPLATSSGYDGAATEDPVHVRSPERASRPASRAPSAAPASRRPSSRAASLAPNGRAASRAPSLPRSVRSISRAPSVPRSTRGASTGPSAPPADAGGNAAAKAVYGVGGEGKDEELAGPEPSAESGPTRQWISPVEMALKAITEDAED